VRPDTAPEFPPAPERDCAASQSQQREKPKPHSDLMAALDPTVSRLVFDTAALRGRCQDAPPRNIGYHNRVSTSSRSARPVPNAFPGDG